MSADANELADRRAQAEAVGDRGEQWIKHYAQELARLPKHTHVVINCRTGEYITGPTSLKAMDEYERRFGKEEPGYMIEIGGGVFVGWGGGVV